MKLKDRVALITGAASGIGRAGAQQFAAAGAQVVVADVNELRGNETANLVRESGGVATFVRTDVSQSAQVQSLVSTVIEQFGKIDILWNNAAATTLCNEQDRPVHELPEAVWDQMLNITLKGVYLCSKYVLPHMMKVKKGVVINTSSTDGLIGQGGYDSYTCGEGRNYLHDPLYGCLLFPIQHPRKHYMSRIHSHRGHRPLDERPCSTVCD